MSGYLCWCRSIVLRREACCRTIPNIVGCRVPLPGARPICADEPELGDGVGTSTTSWAEHDVGGGVLQKAYVALAVQDVATAKADDLLSVRELLLADGAHAVVAVELSHWFSSRRRLWVFSWWRLRPLHRSFLSFCLLLCSASLSLGGAAFMLDVLLQVEEHANVPLLGVVES